MTTQQYDAVGNLTKLVDPAGNATADTYDVLDRMLTETNQLNATKTYSYDAAGNLVSETDRDGRVTAFTYDALNRKIQENWSDSGGNLVNTIQYAYDAAGELTNAGDSASSYTFTYDDAGRNTSVDNAGTPGVPRVVLTYGYDLVGNVNSVSETIDGQAAAVTSYLYDSQNRVISIQQTGTNVADKRVDFSYNAAGQTDTIQRDADLSGNAPVANTIYNYDGAGRLDSLTDFHSGLVLANYQFTLDAAGQITQESSNDGTTGNTYDNTGQLTDSNHTSQANENYSYDANGNRTNSGYATGPDNQLLSDGTYNYAYDAEGNRIKRTEIATGIETDYEWDNRNRLTGVIVKDSSGNVTQESHYIYDVFDRRIGTTVDSDGSGSAAPQVERFIYDRDQIDLTFDGAGDRTHRYLYGPAVDQVLADENALDEILWPLADNLGTIHDIVDSSGVVQDHLVYSSFGRIISQTNPSLQPRFTFTGRETDAVTGLVWYGSRYLDPADGRFISEEPSSLAASGTNSYRFATNSPTNQIDTSGARIQHDSNVSGPALPPGIADLQVSQFRALEQSTASDSATDSFFTRAGAPWTLLISGLSYTSTLLEQKS